LTTDRSSKRVSEARPRIGLPPLSALPFLILTLVFVGYQAWLLPVYHKDLAFDPAIPEGSSPQEASVYLKSLTNEQQSELFARQKRQLVQEPLISRTLLNLGLLYALNGETVKSNDIALRTAERSYRETAAQIAAASLSLSRKDFKGALEHVDAAIRTAPAQSEDFFKIISSIATTPEGLNAVVGKLVTTPPWRADFFISVSKMPKQQSLLYQLFTGLRDRKTEVSGDELQTLLDSEFAIKEYETAYFVWLDFLSAVELRKVGNIFDGQFDLPIRGQYFGWNIVPMANGDISVGVRDGTANNLALSMNLDSARVEGANVFQYLRLEPGPYHLASETKTENFKSSAGLMWRVHCVEDGHVIGQGSAITDAPTWSTYAFDFTVPDDQCQTQQLMLLAASRAALDQTMSGRISFDSFNIAKKE
jgi:tetratricopeptide (TPR) repeat protein